MSFEQMHEDDILHLLHDFGCAGVVATTEHIGYDVYKPTAAIVAFVREVERRTQALLEQPAQEATQPTQAEAPIHGSAADVFLRQASLLIGYLRGENSKQREKAAAELLQVCERFAAHSPATVQAEALSERELFEADWSRRNAPVPIDLRRLPDGRYGDHVLEAQWQTWQARATLATQQAVQAEPVAVAHKGRHVGSAGVHISRLAALDKLPDGVHKLYTATPPTPGQVGALRSDMAGGPVQRYRLYEGGYMEPYIGGDWVTYADVCATFSAPRQVERNREDAEQLAALSGIRWQKTN